MRGLVFRAITAIAVWMVALIRNGKPLLTIVGAVLGAGAGAAAGFVMIAWLVPGALLGILVGATAGAALFPKPPRAEVAVLSDTSESLGSIRHSWAFEYYGVKRLAVLMDRAIYVAHDDKAPWDEVLEKLARGIDPHLPYGVLIWLDTIDSLELLAPDATELAVVYRVGSRIKRRGVFFVTVGDRDIFLGELADQLGRSFVHSERPETFLWATWGPLVVFVVVSSLTVGGVFLSQHWIAIPPPPISRTGKQDEIVRLLSWAGPYGVLSAGGLPILAATAWFLFRVARPNRITILKPVIAVPETPAGAPPGIRGA